MSARIEDLVVADQARELLAALDWHKVRYVVTCTLRTTEEQLALYAQGRAQLAVVQALRLHAGMDRLVEKENRHFVTERDGVTVKSAHQSGHAIDIVPADAHGRPSWNYSVYETAFKGIGSVARSLGWICGQDWPPFDPITGLGWDPPHYEWPDEEARCKSAR